MFIRRPGALGGPGAGGPGPDWRKSELAGTHPALAEFLFLEQWDDGGDRTPGTVLLFSDSGVLKACLNDKGSSRVAFVTASSVAAILEALEAGLLADDLDWRVSREKGPQRKRPGG